MNILETEGCFARAAKPAFFLTNFTMLKRVGDACLARAILGNWPNCRVKQCELFVSVPAEEAHQGD